MARPYTDRTVIGYGGDMTQLLRVRTAIMTDPRWGQKKAQKLVKALDLVIAELRIPKFEFPEASPVIAGRPRSA